MQDNRLAYLAASALLALWCIGLFARDWWRPDEPREAALVQSMVEHPGLALPELGGRTFDEKPPLTYRLAAYSVAALGMNPAATRVPQLLYAVLAFAAVAALTAAIAGRTAALVGGLSFATFSLIYQVQIWLACDALVIAGVTLSLFGMYRGLTATQSSPRFRGYLLMHLGLTLAFFGKNFAAWLVPVSALLVFLVWERRWNELLRWELWVGGLIPVACIGFWISHVAATIEGTQSLRSLFLYNLIGRVVPIASEARHAYTDGHRNWPGKYFIELAYYLLPWTAVGWAATRRAWTAVRADSPQRSAWRFAVCAALPSLLILSCSMTARGIYAAPSLTGLALLIGLWSVDPVAAATPGNRRILKISGGLIACISAIVFLATLVFLLGSRQFEVIGAIGLVTCAAVLAMTIRTLRIPQLDRAQVLARLGLAYALLLSLGVWQLYCTVNRWQDLSAVARATETVLGNGPLVLWRPDETTLAWTDLYLKEKPQRIFYPDDTPAALGIEPLLSHLRASPQAKVLVLSKKRSWSLATWIGYLRSGVIEQSLPTLPDFGPFEGRTDFQIDYLYEAPGGRRYVLLSHRSS